MGVTVDCSDPEQLADFCIAAIGFVIREGNSDPSVTISGSNIERAVNHLTHQKVPEGKPAKHRVHLDVFVDGIGVEVEHLVALGATSITRAGDPSHWRFCFRGAGRPPRWRVLPSRA